MLITTLNIVKKKLKNLNRKTIEFFFFKNTLIKKNKRIYNPLKNKEFVTLFFDRVQNKKFYCYIVNFLFK